MQAYALARLELSSAGKACALTPTDYLVDDHSDGAYAVLKFDADCATGDVEVAYSLFADLDPTHRGLLRAKLGVNTMTAVLGPEQPRLKLKSDRSAWEQFADYAREGVWHIWIGFDHILFLISLLLPAVFVAGRFPPVFWEVFKVVTAFTVAHSITLSLAALSVIELPSRLVESAIAHRRLVFVGGSAAIALIASIWMIERAFDLRLWS